MPQSEFPPEWVEACQQAVHAARYTRVGREPLPMDDDDKAYTAALALAALRTLRRLLDEGGWQVVPKVGHWPREMNKAFCDAMYAWNGGAVGLIPDGIMHAALAAAPSPWGGCDE